MTAEPNPTHDFEDSPPPAATEPRGRLRHVRRVVVATVGAAVTVLGVILMPLPGPGTLIVIAGLAILATEFDWADRAVKALRAKTKELVDRARR